MRCQPKRNRAAESICRAGGLSASALAVLWLAPPAHANTILWVDDASGNIGQVDITTQQVVAGTVHNTGEILMEIGFGTNGTLYGTTFTNLFSINTSTGAATGIGGANGLLARRKRR